MAEQLIAALDAYLSMPDEADDSEILDRNTVYAAVLQVLVHRMASTHDHSFLATLMAEAIQPDWQPTRYE